MVANSTFPDHFSAASSGYASFRPDYPASLFQWLVCECRDRHCAWDCGTGNGQAAVQLAEHFGTVVATDPSEAQIGQRSRKPGVYYGIMLAEAAALGPHSVDLVTVAQALHWFDLTRFYAEVERVLTPTGLLAVWSYGLLRIDSAIDAHMDHFYKVEIGPYWPAERALVDAGYAGIVFPFEELHPPQFQMEALWTLDQLAGYLETWSAVTRYRRSVGHSPVEPFVESLIPLWGARDFRRLVQWPLSLRVGRPSP